MWWMGESLVMITFRVGEVWRHSKSYTENSELTVIYGMHVDGAGGGIIMIGDTITLFKSGSDSDTLVDCSYYIEQ